MIDGPAPLAESKPEATCRDAGHPASKTTIAQDLATPGTELRETHISWVFLRGNEVFKIKKPLDLGFLDFTTVEKRLHACQDEVRLNRRLAPGVYCGLVPVTRDSRGRHSLAGPGPVVDWAVHMVRLPESDRVDVRLDEGRLDASQIRRIAVRLAAFHERARHDAGTTYYGSVDAVGINVRENFEQTRDNLRDYLSAAHAAEIEEWQLGFLKRNAELFEGRIAAGRIRDGHGDLRLEHIYLDDRGDVKIIDCIEFNRRLRYGDVCGDLAFLAMDLTWHRRADLAELLVADYAREANDYDLYALVDFYEGYRAFVRGKVSAIVAADGRSPDRVRRRAAAEARRYFLLALAAERRRVVDPVVVAVGGIIASGKSTVARGLAAALSAPVVDADRTRKHLLGVDPGCKLHVPAFQGGYGPEVTDSVYAEVLRRADVVLRSGRPVVLDASFRSQAQRLAAWILANRRGVPFRFIECQAPAALCRQRLRLRAPERGVSDGRLEIFDEFATSWEPVEELPDSVHQVLDTSLPLAENLASLRERFPACPPGLS